MKGTVRQRLRTILIGHVFLALSIIADHAQPPIPDLSGKWRLEGSDRKMELTQQGTALKGKIAKKNGTVRDVEGKILPSGEVELYEYIPRGDTDIPAAVWNSVLLETEHPKHPGLVPAKFRLTFTSEQSKLEGDRTSYDVSFIKSTAKYLGTKDKNERVRFFRAPGICGPDVTDQTLDVLRRIATDFLSATEAEQSAACDQSVSFSDGVTLKGFLLFPIIGQVPLVGIDKGNMKANYAWDIIELFQHSGTFPKDGDKEGRPSFWEDLTDSSCCTPRYPCGKSVEFFGTCQDQQVVNYVMWGVMKNVCASHWADSKQQEILAFLRNFSGPDFGDQQTMTQVGYAYAEIVAPYIKDAQKYDRLRDKYTALMQRYSLGNATKADLDAFYATIPASELKQTLKIITGFGKVSDIANSQRFPELRQIVNRGDLSSNRPYKVCDTICSEKLSPDQAKEVRDQVLHYRWMPLHDDKQLKTP
ncbi:MAG: hypothetical protein JO053_00040 [Acidobacteria bacterium]|nr:hypothetical protein [Acidobacteriota bacterium]